MKDKELTYPKNILELANRIRTAAKYHGVSLNRVYSDIEGVLIDDPDYVQPEYKGTFAATYKGKRQRTLTIPQTVKPALNYHLYVTDDGVLTYWPVTMPPVKIAPIQECD